MKLFRLHLVAFFALVALWAPAPSSQAATNVVQMGDFFFNPTNLSIVAGDTVRWTNTVLTLHDTTANSGLWVSSTFGRPNTYSFRFTNAGFYPYICQFHIATRPQQTGTVTVVAAPNVPPTVLITNPPNNAVFTAPANVTVGASAADDVSVTNVQFLIGSVVLGNDTVSPYSAVTNGLPAGSYTLSAIASDNNGAKATNSISITVNSPPQSVTLLNPAWSGGDFTFSFLSQSGRLYQVQCTNNLSSGAWPPLTNLTGNGSTLNVTNQNPSGAARFYRVESK
jgi:plastocyanin